MAKVLSGRFELQLSAAVGALFAAGLALDAAAQIAADGANRPPPPAPPPATVPPISAGETTFACIGCAKPFEMEGHKEALKELASNAFVAELRKALFIQDTVHQFESKAHFDNCDFEGGMRYIATLQDEAQLHVTAATASKSNGDKAGTIESAKKAFYALGQALHAVQDFYAHSNYVEVSKGTVTQTKDLQIVPAWKQEGKGQLEALRTKGLISGYVFWGFPQHCPKGTVSHGDLAKDKATTKSGAVKIPHLQNQSQHQIALFLARRASEAFLADAFRRWPLLREVNGELVAFEVLVDRRGL